MLGTTQQLYTKEEKPEKPQVTKPWLKDITIVVYVIFASIAILVFHWIAEGEFSSVLTLSALFELLAFCLLGLHVVTTASVHGISAKSLQLEAIALACRLSSTTWLLGYLPADASGEFLYQCFDMGSLVLVVGLLYQILSIQHETYDSENDQLPVAPFVVCSFLLACIFHSDLDERPIFDILWMCGLFLSAVASVPYLWLMARNKGQIPALTAHFVAAMTISRILSGLYMWDAHEEFECKPWFGNFNHAGWAVLAAHAVHLMLLADFAYFYVKSLISSGLQSPMQISLPYEV